MAISIPPLTAVGASAVLIASVPPGPCTVVVSNTGTAAVIVGTSSTVAAGAAPNGFPLPAGATVLIPCYQGSRGGSLWAVSTSGTNNVGAIISSTQ